LDYLAYISLANAAAYVWLGLFVLAKNSQRQLANWLFCLTMLAVAAMELGHYLVLVALGPGSALHLMRLAAVPTALLPALLYALTLVATRANWREQVQRRRLLVGFFALGSAAFALLTFREGFLGGPVSLEGSPVFVLGPFGQNFYVFFLMACAASLINLEGILRSTSGASRWHVKYGVIGLGGIVVGFVFIISQDLVYSLVRMNYIPVLSAALALSLLPLAYGVVRGRFLEVDVFISRYVIYNSLAALALGGYLVAMGLLARLVGYVGLEYTLFWKFFLFFASGMALAVLLLSADFRKRVQHFVNRHFYKNKYDYRLEWTALSRRLGSQATRQEVAHSIVHMLSETMFVREVSLWLAKDDGGAFSLAAGQGLPEISDSLPAESGVAAWLATRGRTIRAAELEAEVPLAYQGALDLFEARLRAVLITPIMAGERLLGFITVGPERTGLAFIEDDSDLLDSVAAQAAGVLLGSFLSASLVKAQEEQVLHRLASFVIHDLKNFVSMLSLVVQNAERHMANPAFQKDAMATIADTVAKMKALSDRLSAARQQSVELRPEPLRLIECAREVAANLASNGARVEVGGGEDVVVRADREQLGKVLTNLLLNAAEAGAKRIAVSATSESGMGVLSVADDGAGMEREFLERRLFKPFATTKKKGLGIGLYQSKTIIEAHGGRLEADSAPGLGTTFRLRLPSA